MKKCYTKFLQESIPEQPTTFFCDSLSFRWRPYRLEIQLTENRLFSLVRLCAVRSLPGTGRSRVLMHFWTMPVKPSLYIHCARFVSGFLKTLLLWTKYATISRYCLHSIQSGLVFLVARRGETCRRMSTLQSKIQVAICPRPTLARLVCSPQLSRLRSRSCRYKCPRHGEDLHDLMGLRAQMNPVS
jgi:hypothetical protein